MLEPRNHQAWLRRLAQKPSFAARFLARPSFFAGLMVLFAWLGGVTAFAQKDLLYEETLAARQTPFRNQVEAGALYSGAQARDLDDGAFGWDHVVYSSYRFRANDDNLLRFRYQYWDALTQTNSSSTNAPSRHVYEAAWRHRQDKDSATTVSFALMDEKPSYLLGTVYLAQQGVVAGDALWIVQGGAGMNNEDDYHGDIYLEFVKPLSPSTLLRCRNETFASTDGTVNNTFRLNVVQGLSRQLAVNAGYRLYAESPGEEDISEMVSHEGSVATVFEARDNLFFSVGYRYYWNHEAQDVNSLSCEGRWSPWERLSLVGGYQLQHFHTGVTRHGFRGGLSFSF